MVCVFVSGDAWGRKKNAFEVTFVTTAVSPSEYAGKCPKTFMFAAKIVTNGKGTVKYQWVRNDGVRGPVESIRFNEAGTQIVTTSWTLAREGNNFRKYWKAVQIISPNPLVSNPAVFSLKCTDEEGTISNYDIDVSDIYLDEFCRLRVKHTNRGIKTLKAVLREQVWVDEKLIYDSSETFILKPGLWTSHAIGDPGYLITRIATIRVKIDANNHLNEYNEENNEKTVLLTCIRRK
jgi:hypothetical protein